jgi:hypothetical protein
MGTIIFTIVKWSRPFYEPAKESRRSLPISTEVLFVKLFAVKQSPRQKFKEYLSIPWWFSIVSQGLGQRQTEVAKDPASKYSLRRTAQKARRR